MHLLILILVLHMQVYFMMHQTRIIMDFIDCKGSEYSLVDCIHFTHSHGCDHTDDVAIQCQPGYSSHY